MSGCRDAELLLFIWSLCKHTCLHMCTQSVLSYLWQIFALTNMHNKESVLLNIPSVHFCNCTCPWAPIYISGALLRWINGHCVCCSSGWVHTPGGGIAAGPWPGGFPPAGKWHQGEGASPGATHRRSQRWHQGCCSAPPEWPQRWRGVQGKRSVPILVLWVMCGRSFCLFSIYPRLSLRELYLLLGYFPGTDCSHTVTSSSDSTWMIFFPHLPHLCIKYDITFSTLEKRL